MDLTEAPGPAAGEQDVIGWYAGGLTLDQVAARAGMPRSRVARVLDRHGVPRRPRGRPRRIAAERQVIDAYLGGLSLAGTAAVFGAGANTVARVLQRNGVPRRPPGRMRREPEPAAHDGDLLLKAREVAGLLKTSRATVYRLIRSGELDAIRVSERGLRVAEPALQAYLHEQFARGPEMIR